MFHLAVSVRGDALQASPMTPGSA